MSRNPGITKPKRILYQPSDKFSFTRLDRLARLLPSAGIQNPFFVGIQNPFVDMRIFRYSLPAPNADGKTRDILFGRYQRLSIPTSKEFIARRTFR